MANHSAIQKLSKQALETFKTVHGDKSVFLDKLNSLRTSMNRIRATDLGIEPAAAANRVEPSPAAPVGYMFVAENPVVSMGVFVVERGCRLPLHDHRDMHGVLKVLFGTIRVRSYDLLTEEQRKTTDLPDVLTTNSESDSVNSSTDPDSPLALQQSTLARTLLPVRPRGEVELTPDSEPCILTPLEANVHSIESVGGRAAFLDILSPPYDPELGRDCVYYKETRFTDSKENVGDVSWLRKIPQPSSFWCCQEEYLGPTVDLDSL
ncbi:2-aminoethanethiol dioxygenase-like [Acanthaster planci]|uniref:2-aminoethanethiol dioxygenase-like n=1 Tax=Acanthaster planci TaxID=133434 RepID=A0A8B7Y3Q6_ACAPL|nr:2-aminoethanethiol dioxygenase-like [Acanthaster planci]